MKRHIETPRLPKTKVTAVVMSPQNKEAVRSIENMGIEVIATSKSSDLCDNVAYHADMLFSHIGKTAYYAEKNQVSMMTRLTSLGFLSAACDISLNPDYPNDCVLNNLIIDKHLFVGKKTPIHNIYESFDKIYLSQGYVACSVAVVSENAAMTFDKGIASALRRNNIDSCLLSTGEIYLKGHKTGFIGGCCGKLSKDILAFTGKVSALGYFDIIKNFCKKHDVEIVELSTGSVEDIGGIIPITEIK